ncbi:hypothetical protein LCL87_17050 [Rhodococcus hoagii]|nr:hypothetical protein [Prescottella equi]
MAKTAAALGGAGIPSSGSDSSIAKNCDYLATNAKGSAVTYWWGGEISRDKLDQHDYAEGCRDAMWDAFHQPPAS